MQNFKNNLNLILRETKKLYGRLKILSENNELTFFQSNDNKSHFPLGGVGYHKLSNNND